MMRNKRTDQSHLRKKMKTAAVVLGRRLTEELRWTQIEEDEGKDRRNDRVETWCWHLIAACLSGMHKSASRKTVDESVSVCAHLFPELIAALQSAGNKA